MLFTIDHTAIPCPPGRQDMALKFCTEVLGWTILDPHPDWDDGHAYFVMDTKGQAIQISEPKDMALKLDTDGWHHIALLVSDMDEAIRLIVQWAHDNGLLEPGVSDNVANVSHPSARRVFVDLDILVDPVELKPS